MKKSIFTLGLLAASILCLSACGNKKDFNMSFEEALELASHSSIQDVITNADNAEQSVSIAGIYNDDDLNVDAKLTSKSKQNLKDIQSESNISVDLKIQQKGEEEKNNNLDVKGDLDIKFVPAAIYLSLNSLDVKGDESTESVAEFVSGYLNQWFSIPLNETIDLNSFNMKDKFDLSSKIKEVINNEGFQVYSGKFTDYNGYNARKFSIDDEKLIKILKDSYNSLDEATNNTKTEAVSTDERAEDSEEVSEENTENSTEENVEDNIEIVLNDELGDINSELDNIKIENFEGYLVIIGKDKVAIAIDNMDITDNGETTNLNGLLSDKEVLLSVFSEGEEVITLSAIKKGSHFNTSLNLSGLCYREGTITPNISSSKIDIDFDLTLTVTATEKDIIVPLKGNWSYASISEFKVEIPSESTDLTQMLGGLLGGGLYGGGDDYYYDDYYDDYELDAEDFYNEELTTNTEEETINVESSNDEENVTETE